MKVAILGCGPAGMFAAHAAVSEGHDVRIFSKPRKSFMRGAQYLHRPIPGLSRNPFRILYSLQGDSDGYRDKVYGRGSEVQVSPETLLGVSDAWDIREAYDEAWDLYSHLIMPWDALSDWVPQTFDLVFSTIPAPLLCRNTDQEIVINGNEGEIGSFRLCEFKSEMVFSTADAAEAIGEDDNTVLCSGVRSDLWYRTARIHGWETTEYPEQEILERGGASRVFADREHWLVQKPISTTCHCHPEVVRSGRYGKWTKGVLSHESYYDMKEALK